MIRPRHAGIAVVAIFSLLLAFGGHHQAASQERRALPAPARTPLAAKPATAGCQRSAFRVVVDVGHTVAVPGAVSARGIPEYAFNLQLATEVKQTLVDAGFDKTVLLITDKAPPAGLIERVRQANSLPANLFISIHHDSVPDELLETWEYGGQQQHFSDRFKGYSLFISNENADFAGSLLFGKLLGKELQARGLQYTPHYTLPLMGHRRRLLVDAEAGVYRYDQLIVLQRTRMAAVLLEAGSIVNRDEEAELATPQRRSITSAAVAAAVEDFCTTRAAPASERPAKRPPPRHAAAQG